MGFFERLFGARKAKRTSPVVDLRSSEELEIEAKARKRLDRENEGTAQLLVRLSRESKEMGDPKFQKMTSVGEQLYSKGGHELMQLVCYRVRNLGGSHTYLST